MRQALKKNPNFARIRAFSRHHFLRNWKQNRRAPASAKKQESNMERLKHLTKTGGFKIFLLVILILLFLIPVAMIRGIIEERSGRADAAEEEIMASWGDQFVIQGPGLRIPCKERQVTKTRNAKGELVSEILELDFFLWLAPEELRVDVELGTEIKNRGIFSVPLFAGTARFSGQFDPAQISRELKDHQEAFPEKAELVISLASQRGIRGIEQAVWNGRDMEFLPGNQGFGFKHYTGGIHGDAAVEGAGKHRFDITMAVQGGKSLRMVPLGKDSIFSVKADWPSPSFQGSYLPLSRTIGEEGFEARWEVSHLSRNIPLAWSSGGGGGGAGTAGDGNFDLAPDFFTVDFFKVLDHYAINIRAVKYALLFIIIPFLSLFLFELLLRREIHPVQYLLAGIGNVIFYLLLLSFSEHLPFPPAYWIAALAVTAMMTLYSRSLLGAWNKSWLMGLVMFLCYTFLYFTLQSEDWALLIGSIGAFGITGLVMFLTRKLDWFSRKEPKTVTDTFDKEN
jgi:inner membrane protein